ncbi:MAG: Intracellular exo-alpha-(1-_5)-L-arabinofuranosidase 1 [Candidatus Hydrogenedentes bacterium ADurb.Bin101]|jgi:alpha-N-arabinofuranosidase|nr:MAG: Intracellular exo-alpha-(1->5)-L-arabinofuranosidase 1 [Candidatus Hydrogenedentes bacterium ADurb.Bin101]
MKHVQTLSTLLLAVVLLTSGCSEATAGPVQIDARETKTPISPYVYGQFIEHLGRCIYGGIWAEMLEDRKFFFPVDGKQSGWDLHKGKEVSWEGDGVPYEILIASPWQILGPPEAVTMNTVEPFVGDHDPVITLDGAGEPRGIYHPRLALEKGREYTGYIILKALGEVGRVEVALQWGNDAASEAVAVIEQPGDAFMKHPFTFTAGGDAKDGRLAILCLGKGAVHIGAVSLMPADNVDGFRKDVLALLRELDAPVYRWPGGNFVSGYDWRDGIGERDQRPPRKNPAWTGIEHNDMGIHEYLHFCELINTEPFIALNTGLGDVTSAAAEVEYITRAADTPEGAKRAANGRTEPWKVKFWAVGNEMYGDWQLGHMPLEDYVKKHTAVVDAIRAVSPEAQCIGVGAAGEWSETMLTHCADHMELISEHLYWQHKDDVTKHVQVAVDSIDRVAEAHRGYRDSIPGLKEKDIRIALDEWNYWYGPNLYGEIGVRYFMRDALGCAAALHAMFRHSDLYFMANYAQTVNVIGAIKTTGTDAWLETTGQVLKLYRHHFGTIPVEVEAEVPGVDVAAAWTEDRSALTLAAVNTTGKPKTLQLEVDELALPENVSGWTIQHDDPEAYNDEKNKDTVAIQEVSVPVTNGSLEVPPYSVTLLVVPAREQSTAVLGK